MFVRVLPAQITFFDLRSGTEVRPTVTREVTHALEEEILSAAQTTLGPEIRRIMINQSELVPGRYGVQVDLEMTVGDQEVESPSEK